MCTTDATVCATKAGQTTKMACAEPADGRYLDGGIATECTTQGTGVCTTDATVCATKAGQTTKMACAVAVAGHSLDGGIAIGTCA